MALVVIAIGVAVALLRVAEDFFIPLLIGILASYTLRPLVSGLQRIRVPRAIGAALVLAAVTVAASATVYSLRDDAVELAEQLPEAARKLRLALRAQQGTGSSPLANVQRAAAELDQAAAEATGAPPATRRPPAPTVDSGLALSVKQFLLAQTTGVLGLFAQLAVAAIIAYLLLVAGDAFRRKVARLAGPTLARRRVTVEIFDEIDAQVQRFMLVLLVTNLLIGFATWAFYTALGVERAMLWGVLAGVLHVVPYVGTAMVAMAAAVAGLIQFGEIGLALGLAGGTLTIAFVIGMGLTTWLQSRATRMNAVVVFVGILFFGWLWGPWGLLLGVPLLAVVKTVADRVEAYRPLAELMGE